MSHDNDCRLVVTVQSQCVSCLVTLLLSDMLRGDRVSSKVRPDTQYKPTPPEHVQLLVATRNLC